MNIKQRIGLWVVFVFYVIALITVFGDNWYGMDDFPRIYVVLSAFIPLALLTYFSFK